MRREDFGVDEDDADGKDEKCKPRARSGAGAGGLTEGEALGGDGRESATEVDGGEKRTERGKRKEEGRVRLCAV